MTNHEAAAWQALLSKSRDAISFTGQRLRDIPDMMAPPPSTSKLIAYARTLANTLREHADHAEEAARKLGHELEEQP